VHRGRRRLQAAKLVLTLGTLCGFACALVPAEPPTENSRALRTEGAALFQQKGCAHCHGSDAHGTDRAPTLAGSGKRLHAAGIEKQICEGGKQMPAFGDSLSDHEVQALVEFVKHQKK
jgi:mono/diheme cytochrome c family protein